MFPFRAAYCDVKDWTYSTSSSTASNWRHLLLELICFIGDSDEAQVKKTIKVGDYRIACEKAAGRGAAPLKNE
jgi:hypothetical protein